MANGRCHKHGGKSTGPIEPKLGKENHSTTHGIYSRFYTDEEKALDLSNGSVAFEIKVARIQLLRTLEAKAKWDANADKTEDIYETGMDLVEITREDGDRVVGESVIPISSIRKVRKRPDFERLTQVWLNRIESLEKTERELQGTGGSGGPEDKAREILEAVDEMDGQVPDPENPLDEQDDEGSS